MFEKIPNELKFDALWCLWKKTDKGKVPFNALTGGYAKSNDKNTFFSYKTVLGKLKDYYKLDENRKLLGGLGLGIFNGFSAIDIDHCINDNGEISDMAQEIINYCQSYTEISPSGTGIRIIFKTDFKNFDKTLYYTNNQKIGLEIYIEGATNKFVTITGNCILSIGVVNVDIQYILDKYMCKNTNGLDIDKFLAKDKKLNELWNKKASGSGGDESESDLALLSKLAFYYGKDTNKMRTMFEKSPYFLSKDDEHRKKWLRKDYSENTLQKAISGVTAVYGAVNNKRYDLNDTGNAHRFVDEFGDNIKYNVDNKMWMEWNGSNWQFDVFNNVKNLAEILIEKMRLEAFEITDLDRQKEYFKNINRLFNVSGKESMIKEAQHLKGIPVMNDMFDKDDYILNTQNCIINLRNGDLYKHDKEMLLNKITDSKLSKKEPKLFLKFLNEMFPQHPEIVDYLHKAFGYSLTGSTKEQVMFILQGEGNDGKSLLLQIINEVIGDYACVSSPELLLDKKTQTANLSEVARLKGIRFCTVNELKMNDKLNESGVKDITGGNNKIVARFLYANEFEFLPKMKIWLATNYEPKIIGTDKGIWRRIILIPCKHSLNDDEVDKDLIDKLRTEKDEILGWLVQGCLLWQKEGLKLPFSLMDAKTQYKTEMDIIQRWVNEYCEIGPEYKSRASELFANFKEYCIKFNEFPMSQTLFGRNFSKKFEKRSYNGLAVYLGVRLKNHI